MYHTFQASERECYGRERRRTMKQHDLDKLRGRVDELNSKILDLINERTTVVQEIGKVKEKQGVNQI